MDGDARDLSFVAPARRAETVRRIGVIKRFLAKPGRRAAEACAAELGISAGQFYTLVKAWKETGRAEGVAGSGRPRNRPSTITEEQAAIIAEAAKVRQRPFEALDLALKLAGERGVTMPHLSAVRRHYERTRPRRLPDGFASAGASLVLDACAVGLAVDDGSPVRPIMTVVIEMERARIVGLALSVRGFGPSSAAAALVDALVSATPAAAARKAPVPSLAGWRPAKQDWASFDQALAAVRVDSSVLELGHADRARGVTGLLGTRHAGIQLLPRLTLASSEKRRSMPVDGHPMDIGTATELLRGRIIGTSSNEAMSGLDEIARMVLRDELQRVLSGRD